VLHQVATYLQAGIGGQVPFLSNVFEHPPKWMNEVGFYDGQAQGISSGAIVWLWLGPEYSRRIELQGVGPGGEMRTYDLHLQCVLLSSHTEAQDADNDNNTFIDALRDWIAQSKTCGTSTGGEPFIWSWGEGPAPNGGVDKRFEASWPTVPRSGIMHVYTKGNIWVNEYVSATTT